MGEILTMHDASEAVAKTIQPEYVLSDGQAVKIKKLSWLHFDSLWQEISGIIAQGLLVQGKEAAAKRAKDAVMEMRLGLPTLPDGTPLDSDTWAQMIQAASKEAAEDRADADHATLDFISNLTTAPETVGKLISMTTDLDTGKLNGMDFDDVLGIALLSFQFNFIGNRKIMGFSKGAWNAVTGGQQVEQDDEANQ